MHHPLERNSPARLIAAALLLAVACAVLGGCAERDTRYFEQRLYSMGTWVDIAVGAPDERRAAAALEDVESMLRRFEVDYYAWADGELARLNRSLAGGRDAVVSDELAALLRESQRLAASSGGAFEPGVGELIELWGFHTAPEPGAGDPDPEAIDAWLRSAVRIGALSIDGNTVRASGRRVKLDLGGIAKGEAVDRAIDLLRRHGIRDALVNAGGDVRVIGRNGERSWRIGIQSPRGDEVLGVIELADGEAAFTSGDYERFFEQDGRRRHHILDPRTGYPAADTQAVTVVATSGVLADAAATAIFVAGTDGWRPTARAMGIHAALRVGADGGIAVTSPMADRLTSRTTDPIDVVADS